ncbi:hypothetical protein LINPERPRIM_LOCUS30962 [Linum perenne]
MLRLQKKRFDFKFSNLQALQVPKGWDRLLVSMVSIETGKTVAKSGRAVVRNGSCRWTETLSESITTISQLDTSKENQDFIFKFVVAMVKIQCSVAQEKPREERLEDTGLYAEHFNLAYIDVENKSDASSVHHPDSPSHTAESSNKDLRLSASGSHCSFDSPRSMDSSLSRENSSRDNNLTNSSGSLNGREDMASSFHDPSGLDHFSFNSKSSTAPRQPQSKRDEHYSLFSSSVASSPSWNGRSPKRLPESGEFSTEELRAQAKMWEQNARKLMADVEKLQEDISDRSIQQARLEKELSESRAECDGVKMEMQQQKILLEESPINQLASESANFQSLELENILQELESEIKYQKESNADLALQLKKTQESNMELVSTLLELEDTVEGQKMEIANLSKLQSKNKVSRPLLFSEEDESRHVFVKNSRNVICNWDMEGTSVYEPGDHAPFFSEPEDNRGVEVEGLQSHESQKNLKSTIRVLERSLEQKVEELQFEQSFHIESMKNQELEWKARVAQKEEVIAKLEANLSKALDPLDFGNQGESTHVKEIEVLKLKMEELEKDCSELTNENLQLLLKLKESQKDPSTFGDSLEKSRQIDGELLKYRVKSEEQESQIAELKLQLKSLQEREVVANDCLLGSCKDMNTSGSHSDHNMSEPLQDMSIVLSEVDKLKSYNLMKDQEVEALKLDKKVLESQISNLQIEKHQLEEKMDVMFIEDSATSRCFDDSGDEMTMFSSSMSSQVSARQSPGLERCKSELEAHLTEMEKENVQLYERICGLEAQLRYLTDESQLNRLEVEISQSDAMNLKEEIGRLKGELEVQKVDLRQKTQNVHKQWLEMQEECESLKMENLKLLSSSGSLKEECSLLQKSNLELKKQKTLLHEQCSVLEAELKDSEKVVKDMFKEVEALEGKYDSLLEEISSKERAFILELDTLVHDNRTQKHTLAAEMSFLSQMNQEKTVLVENLQSEVELLTAKISATHDEQEINGSEALLEVSRLRAVKAALEATLKDAQQKLRLSETNFSTLQMESDIKLQELRDELEACNQKEEVLAADNEKLLELVEDVNSSKEKQRGTIRWLELKLKAAEYEKLQVAEEISNLEVQMHKTTLLQEENLALKKSLNEVKFENQRLQASVEILSEDYEGLKIEKMATAQKISKMEKALTELEECKRSKASLEEKVFRIELDLTAREAQGGQDAELKNELARVKITNSGLFRRIRHLEEEKQEHLKRAQTLEKALKQTKGIKFHHHDSSNPGSPSSSESTDTHNNGPEDTEAQTKPTSKKGNLVRGTDPWSQIELLENELVEALEANEMYKSQLKSLLTGPSKDSPNSIRQWLDEEEGESGTRSSSVASELKDLQERYSHMSLKYAEVEAERAQLVLKLRSDNSGKRMLSS